MQLLLQNFGFSMAESIQKLVLLVVTLCGLVSGYRGFEEMLHLSSDQKEAVCFSEVTDIHQQDYMMSQPRSPQYEHLLPIKCS
jgi:hypothetical protein